MNFFQKFRDFIQTPTHKRTLGFLGILTFVGIISLTVIVSQQQQQTRQRASGHDVCSAINFIPDCSSDLKSGSSCVDEQLDDKCKLNSTIYECSAGGVPTED